jgi:transposase-like protein
VLYEVLSGTPVAALQSDHATTEELVAWLQPYRELPYKALATLSDGEEAIIAALKTCWPEAPHQRCQAHVLNNLAKPVLEVDTQLRQRMREDVGGLSAVPTACASEEKLLRNGRLVSPPPFCPPPPANEMGG